MSSANRESWKTLPKPDLSTRLEFDASFSGAEVERILIGIVPKEMEDKWFVFCEGEWVYFHRSWSGALIYWVQLEEVSANVNRIKGAWVNRDPEQYKESDDSRDLELLNFLFRSLLLGQEEPFPFSPEDSAASKGVAQHHFSGTGGPETQAKKKPWWRFW